MYMLLKLCNNYYIALICSFGLIRGNIYYSYGNGGSLIFKTKTERNKKEKKYIKKLKILNSCVQFFSNEIFFNVSTWEMSVFKLFIIALKIIEINCIQIVARSSTMLSMIGLGMRLEACTPATPVLNIHAHLS